MNDFLLWAGADSTISLGRVGLNIGTPIDLRPGEWIEFAFDSVVVVSLA